MEEGIQADTDVSPNGMKLRQMPGKLKPESLMNTSNSLHFIFPILLIVIKSSKLLPSSAIESTSYIDDV